MFYVNAFAIGCARYTMKLEIDITFDISHIGSGKLENTVRMATASSAHGFDFGIQYC